MTLSDQPPAPDRLYGKTPLETCFSTSFAAAPVSPVLLNPHYSGLPFQKGIGTGFHCISYNRTYNVNCNGEKFVNISQNKCLNLYYILIHSLSIILILDVVILINNFTLI